MGKRLLTLCLCCLIGIQLYAATFARLEVDDYGQMAQAQRLGVIGAVVRNYQAWSSRYSQVAMSSALYLVFGSHAPAAGAILSVILLIVSLTYAFHPWTRAAFQLALALTWGFLSSLTNWYQSLLWLPGNITYLFPLALLVLLLGWLVRPVLASSSADSAKP